jgi:hypothetical protein
LVELQKAVDALESEVLKEAGGVTAKHRRNDQVLIFRRGGTRDVRKREEVFWKFFGGGGAQMW